MQKDRSNPRAGEASDGDEPRPPESIGLCARCRFLRTQPTKRGTTFYRCGRADDDASFMQYPPIPVVRCQGFERD